MDQGFGQSVLESFGGLPPLGVILAGSMVGAGALVWLVGGKLVRPLSVVLGVLAGSLLGAGLIAELIAPHVDTTLPPIVPGLVAGTIGGVLGFAAYRFVCAGITGITAGGLVLVAALCVSPRSGTTENAQAPARVVPVSTTSNVSEPESHDTMSGTFEAVRRWIPQGVEDRWTALDTPSRRQISIAAMAAALLAAIAGVIAPLRSSTFATSALGSGLALAGFARLTDQTAIDASLSLTPWLVAWCVLSLLGMAVQFGGASKPAPQPS